VRTAFVYTGGVSKVADPIRRDDRRFTYGDYVAWPDDERWELIDGVAFNMSAAPARRHQDILGSLYVQVRGALHGKGCRTYLAPFDVRLPEAAEGDAEVRTVVQPDLVVICDPAKLDDAGCRGAPDLLVEILSPSTAYKDQTTKLELYERHAVREYWVINPARATVTVHRLGPNGSYGRPEVVLGSEEIQAHAVAGLVVRLAEVFAD
jgi:Uma2 family endonuclease